MSGEPKIMQPLTGCTIVFRDFEVYRQLLPFSTIGLLHLTGIFAVGPSLGTIGELALGFCQFGTGELTSGLRDEADALDILAKVVAEEGG